MDRGRIEREADMYASVMSVGNETYLQLLDGFIVGAEWRINDVWHEPSESPSMNIDKYGMGEDVLVKVKCKDFIEMCTVYEESCSSGEFELLNDRSSYSMEDIEKWAYVFDLVPLSMIKTISRKTP